MVGETLFTEPDAAKATSALRLRQKVKQDKLITLYRNLSVTVDPDLYLDRFRLTTNPKICRTTCFFLMDINIGNTLPINTQVSFLKHKQ